MRSAVIATALIGLLSAGAAMAQAPGSTQAVPGPNARGTQPQPGGGVSVGPGAPTSAAEGVNPMGRGAPPAGSASPSGLGSGTGGSRLTPGGAIRPGNPTLGGQNSGGGG